MKIQLRPIPLRPQQTEGTSSTSQSSDPGKSSPLGNFKTKAKQALQRVQAAVTSSNNKVKALVDRTTQKLQAMKAKITEKSGKQQANPYGDYSGKGESNSSTRSHGPGEERPPDFKPESPKQEHSNRAPTPPPQSAKPPLVSQGSSASPPPPPPPRPSGPGGPNPIKAEDLARQAGNLKPTVTNDRSAPLISGGGSSPVATPPPQSAKPPLMSQGPSASPPPPPPRSQSGPSASPPPPPPPRPSGPGGPNPIKAEDLATQRGKLKPVNQDNPGEKKTPSPTAPKPKTGLPSPPDKGSAPQFVMSPEMLSNVKLKNTKGE